MPPQLLPRPSWRSCAALAVALAAALLLSGCYSARTAWGGLRMMARRQPVERMLADPAIDAGLAARLRTARQLVEYAGDELSLPVGRAYDSYVELGRPYATWTVTAAPELSVEPVVWCFPVAGCVSYRGYFSEERARRFAARLEGRGFDVEMGGVRAFSTLGWFRDPLLSSFLDLPEPDLAALLFHELAHRRLYVKDDTTFNESFASVVEEAGVARWLGGRGRHEDLASWRATRRRDEEVTELVLATRARLAEAYAAERPDDWKRRRKAELLDELRAAYRSRREEWGEGWDGFFGDGLDNARLTSLASYAELLPGLRRLLAANGGDLERFYAAAEELAGLSAQDRRRRLVETVRPGVALP